jgi:hypothetical protein
MGVFEILFVAMTIALPTWLWTRASTEKAKTDWTVWEKNFARIVESDQGFPGCPTLNVIDTYRDLCQASQQREAEGHPIAVERASPKVVFTCLFAKKNINVAWRLENSSSGTTLDCGDPGGHIMELGPGFNFNLDGRIKSFEFWSQDNDRESIPYRNCRIKAGRAKSITPPPPTLRDFLQKLGRIDKDPGDFLDANLMCLVFDSSPQWKPWREKYEKEY